MAAQQAKEPIEAADLFTRAAQSGHTGAMVRLGLFLTATGKSADGIAWLHRAAVLGNSDASELAPILENMTGIAQATQAAQILIDSSSTETIRLPTDDYSLLMRAHSHKDAGDLPGAEALLQRAIDGGSAIGAYELGVIRRTQGDNTSAIRWYRIAAQTSSKP